MTEIQNKRHSSMRTRGFGVSNAKIHLNKLNALSKGKRVMETVLIPTLPRPINPSYGSKQKGIINDTLPSK